MKKITIVTTYIVIRYHVYSDS